MNDSIENVPNGLRTWFVVHFVVDVLFAIPLLFFPQMLLDLFNWRTYDPIMTRLVGAALMGIGVESLLGRNASADTFRAMLNLKVIWASSALIAIGIGIAEGVASTAWSLFTIFFVFWCVWVYYHVNLGRNK
ncbi:MAG: hypothetical protein PVJ21_25055 [Anaerolineales bacterium]|jgi:hypothetical protein